MSNSPYLAERVTAFEFARPMQTGRTLPGAFRCLKADGSIVDVVVKFSAGCSMGGADLAKEILASSLAAMLGIQTPKTYIVDIPQKLSRIITDTRLRDIAIRSCPVAFGSALEIGATEWPKNQTTIPSEMMSAAVSIWLFDALIENPDRRVSNPNLLHSSQTFHVIDHELAWPTLIIGAPKVWQPNGMAHLGIGGNHVFTRALRGKELDLDTAAHAWSTLEASSLSDHASALPIEWSAEATAERVISQVHTVRTRLTEAVVEARRTLA